MAIFSGAVLIQTSRVIVRDRDLTRSNAALTGANTELSTLNEDLVESNRQLEETRDQLILSEKMASLGNLVAGVAHEVNTPIGAFNSAADTLKRCIERISRAVNSATTAEDVRKDRQYQRAMKVLSETTDTAVVAGKRVTTIVDSLRHFAHLDEAEYQQVDLHASLDSIVTLKAHDLTDRISITKNYGDIPSVTCYASELNQVFMNIFTNAIEAIEGSGGIEIETGCTHDQVVVSFSDTGSGIKPGDLGHIFDPGFTTKGVGVGVGLGLATAYRIIQKHGGRINVASEEGKGSTFSVQIPLVVEGGV